MVTLAILHERGDWEKLHTLIAAAIRDGFPLSPACFDVYLSGMVASQSSQLIENALSITREVTLSLDRFSLLISLTSWFWRKLPHQIIPIFFAVLL